MNIRFWPISDCDLLKMMANAGARNKRETIGQQYRLFREKVSKVVEWEKVGWKSDTTWRSRSVILGWHRGDSFRRKKNIQVWEWFAVQNI